MKCDNCQNYQIHPSGVDEGYYTACKEYKLTIQVVNTFCKEDKQKVMDGLSKNCKGFRKL